MRPTILLLLLGAACQSARTSPYFNALGDEAKDFVARSAPEATWTTRLQTEPKDASPPLLPGLQVVAFETGRTLDEAEVRDLHDRLEFEIVRSLVGEHVRLVSRRETTAQPGVRGVSWEYDTGDRRGILTLYGVRREPGYEVIFTVCEMTRAS
ncbi:MAG TPA: hypothetical protein VFY93_13185 [Planctomycetota bacterium]|nr:hypothetical protein [Planctomycetota bacterium]